MNGIAQNYVMSAYDRVTAAQQNLFNGVVAYGNSQTTGIGSPTANVVDVMRSSQELTNAKMGLSLAELMYKEEQKEWKQMLNMLA